MEFAILFLLPITVVVILAANAWIHKVDLEREYLQSLIEEQKKNKNSIRKI